MRPGDYVKLAAGVASDDTERLGEVIRLCTLGTGATGATVRWQGGKVTVRPFRQLELVERGWGC